MLSKPNLTERNDTVLFSKNPNGHNALYKLEDGIQSLIFDDSRYDYWWAKVSPDKSKLLVYRSPENPDKNHDDYQNAELVIANIDGSDAQVIIEKNKFGWNAHGLARWNADETKILMAAEPAGNGLVQCSV